MRKELQQMNDMYTPYSNIICDTPGCSWTAAGGRITHTTVNLTNNGATHQNLFTVTGAIRVLQIYAIATVIGDSTTFSGVDFDVFDQATATVMTGATDCSGIAVKDIIAKMADDGTAVKFIDGSVAAYAENATMNKSFGEGVIVESSAGVTNIRLGYTGDGTTDVTLQVIIRWQPMTFTSTVT